MKQWNVYRLHYYASALLVIAMATALMTFPVHASEPEPSTSDWQPGNMGLNKEQAQAIAKAREEQSAKSYSKQEQAAIDLAIRTVNEKTPVSRDSISNLRIRVIQWPDSSLGCAEPGVEYLQRVVPGYFVSFSTDDKIYSVHIGDGSAVVCDQINDYLVDRRKRGMSIISTYQAARIDLAKKLKVEPKQITVIKIQPETWKDSSLGCPVSGQQYQPGPIKGLRINMTCRDREYEYRTTLDGGDFVSCKEIVSCHETE